MTDTLDKLRRRLEIRPRDGHYLLKEFGYHYLDLVREVREAVAVLGWVEDQRRWYWYVDSGRKTLRDGLRDIRALEPELEREKLKVRRRKKVSARSLT